MTRSKMTTQTRAGYIAVRTIHGWSVVEPDDIVQKEDECARYLGSEILDAVEECDFRRLAATSGDYALQACLRVHLEKECDAGNLRFFGVRTRLVEGFAGYGDEIAIATADAIRNGDLFAAVEAADDGKELLEDITRAAQALIDQGKQQ